MIDHRSGLRLSGLRSSSLDFRRRGYRRSYCLLGLNRVGGPRRAVHQHQIFHGDEVEGSAPWGPCFLGLRPDQHPVIMN